MITPPTAQSTLAIASLLEGRLASAPDQAQPSSPTLLDQLQVHQYLSPTGLTESLSDISDTLFAARQKPAESSRTSPTSEPSILLLLGLSDTLGFASRRKGATYAAGIGANILRTLRHLARSHPGLLVLLDLDLEVRRLAASATAASRSAYNAPSRSTDAAVSNALASAFSPRHGEILTLAPSLGVVGDAVGAGVDVIVGLHDGFDKAAVHDRKEAKKRPDRGRTTIVEVLKDRTGAKLGEWCLWVQAR